MGWNSFDRYEDNIAYENLVGRNRQYVRDDTPTVSKATKQAALKLAVLYELAYKGLSGYSDQAVADAYTTLADELMQKAGYVNEHGQLTFEAQPDGSARIMKAGK